MPPALDSYLLTRHRNHDTIERFLNDYVDREASEDYTGGELSVISLSPLTSQAMPLEDLEWVPVSTLTDVIRFGLSKPARAFFTHLRPKHPTIDYVVLAFTTDDQLILGLSIDDEGGTT